MVNEDYKSYRNFTRGYWSLDDIYPNNSFPKVDPSNWCPTWRNRSLCVLHFCTPSRSYDVFVRHRYSMAYL